MFSLTNQGKFLLLCKNVFWLCLLGCAPVHDGMLCPGLASEFDCDLTLYQHSKDILTLIYVPLVVSSTDISDRPVFGSSANLTALFGKILTTFTK